MGTDIHAFVEVDHGGVMPFFSRAGNIRAFNSGEFFIPNKYKLFDALGNGRSRNLPSGSVDRWALFPPRGLPPTLSDAVFIRYYHIVADPTYRDVDFDSIGSLKPALPEVSREQAEDWVARGLSHYCSPPLKNALGRPARDWVSNPDLHSPSWLTISEVCRALEHHGLCIGDVPVPMQIVMVVMQEFERILGGGRSRLVFWFDN